MWKVNYHYKVRGEAKQFVAKVFMTFEEACEYILGKFDDNVYFSNEHNDNCTLGEGAVAEICANVIREHYTIEYVAEV
jgi:hypothetical protein